MKPLLRALLAVNGGIVLLFGLACLLTPWLVSLYAPLAGFVSTPAMMGQMLGVALLAFAALQFHAMVDGALTGAVARIGGHMMWVMGVVLLIWELALGQPVVSGDGRLVATLIGIGLLLLGLVQARLGGMVRGRERRLARGEISAARAEQGALQAKLRQDPNELTTKLPKKVPTRSGDSGHGDDPYFGTPSGAVTRDATESRFSSGPAPADSVYPVSPAPSLSPAPSSSPEKRSEAPPSF